MTRRQNPGAPAAPAAVPVKRTFRLRHLLIAGGAYFALGWVAPRIKATWQLRDASGAMADYARCMAGPTGPGALRDDPPRYRATLRRRLLAVAATERPFAACVSLVKRLTASPELEKAHAATAAQFVEYSELPVAALSSNDAPLLKLDETVLNTSRLEALQERAWPFVRQSYRTLLKSSTTAREAPHPQELALPAVGHGFPAKNDLHRNAWYARGTWYAALGGNSGVSVQKSLDSGVHWEGAPLNLPELPYYSGRCAAIGTSNSFLVRRDASNFILESWNEQQLTAAFRLDPGMSVLRTACDSKTLVGVVQAGEKGQGILSCEHGGGCEWLKLDPAWLTADYDVAQVDGVTVLLTSGRGITRIRSSRDRGQNWTPAVVAFDAAAFPGVSDRLAAPNQLLVMGKRLMLFGPPHSRNGQVVLYSENAGASFLGASTEPQKTSATQSRASRE